MPGPVFLEGETVELRTIEQEDAEELQRILNDPRVREGLLRADPLTQSDEEEWIESAADRDDEVVLAVCVDGELVGDVGMHSISPVHGTAEIGYILTPDAWGNGYATDAAATMTRYAFAERGLAKLYARVFETNRASQRVLEKVGFEREGTFRDHVFVDGERIDEVRYGLLAEEWDGH